MKSIFLTAFLILDIIMISLCSSDKIDYSATAQQKGWDIDACKNGMAQSPIDININNLLFENTYNFYSEKIKYNNFTFKANIKATDNYINIYGDSTLKSITAFTITYNDSQTYEYYLDSIHFHVPSEHTIFNISIPAEAHFVHYLKNATIKRSALVFGVFFNLSSTDIPWVQSLKLSDHASSLKASLGLVYTQTINSPREVLALAKGSVLKYEGSLTTPPCTEIVNWFVLEKMIPISEATLDILSLKTIRGGATDKGEFNNRYTQDLNKRTLTFGNMDLSMMMGDNS